MRVLSLSLLLLLLATVSQGRPSVSVPNVIELLTSDNIYEDEAEVLAKQKFTINYHNCQSWHLGVETYNIRDFKTVPENCKDYVIDYLTTSYQYGNDSKTVCKEAYFYAKGLALNPKAINVWIFDIDDTLLSTIPFNAQYSGYGTEVFDSEEFKKWVKLGEAPVLPETLHLYKNLLELGIKPIFITERREEVAEATVSNLRAAGFHYWENIFFKPDASNAKTSNYKSKVRKNLVKSGYTIIGNIGDQWGDLIKASTGRRTFKLPNPMYYTY